MRRQLGYLGLVAALVLGVGGAHAAIIQFSGDISDADGPGAEAFDAEVEWEFLELDQVLCVTITNQTTAPNEYTISQFNFNTSDAVTALALITDPLDPLYNSAFPDAASGGSSNAGGFGTFDWSLDLDSSGNDGVLAGDSTTFYFNVTGDSLTEDDFFSHGTEPPNGSDTAVAIIHFTRGPDDDSTWGIPGRDGEPPPVVVVPEPASMTLIGLGLAAMVLRRARRVS
jgi:hypothetical protein